MTNKKTIIITGSLGQNGKILSRLLVEKGYQVIGVLFKNNKNKEKKVKYINLDLKNLKLLSKSINKFKPTHIIHFGSKNPSYEDKDNFYKENYVVAKNIIDSIIKINKNIIFIFPNTSQIFKKKNYVNENDKFKITNTYTKFRIKIYEYLKFKKKTENLKFCNLILFNHDSRYRKKTFLLPRLISYVKKRDFDSIKNIYKENIIVDFSHAEDICNAIYLIIKKNICIDKLILSSGKKTYINNIINYLLDKLLNIKKFKQKTKNNNNFIIGRNKLAKKILNWKAKKNIFIAINDMIDSHD